MVRARIWAPTGAPPLAKVAKIHAARLDHIIQLDVRSRQSLSLKIKYDRPLGLIPEPGVDILPRRTGQ